MQLYPKRNLALPQRFTSSNTPLLYPCHPSPSRKTGSPISTAASLTSTYRLYPSSPPNAEPIHFDSADFDLDDDPKPVTAANGFSTIRPRESITRDMTMVPSCFEAKPGVKCVLRMPGGYGWIDWWGVEEMEAFKGAEVRCTEWSEDGRLKVRISNEIEVFVEE